jgi:transposase
MSMGKRTEKQPPLWLGAGELPRSPGHRFYETLNKLLREADFDRSAETLCARFYEADGTGGRPSIPPGVYFRMLLIGYFEGIESERGIAWRCADSLSLRQFLGLLPTERIPDHSSLSRIRTRLDAAIYEEVFRLVLGIVEKKGLLKGNVAGVDSTYLRADASMKAILRKDTSQTYQEYLKKLCQEQGIENPTPDDCRRIDRKRKGKRTSNQDWKSKTDADARIMRIKDGRTRLAYKAEHVVDMETGVVVAAQIYAADAGDTSTITPSLEKARENIDAATKSDDDDKGVPPAPPAAPSDTATVPDAEGTPSNSSSRRVIEVVGDKGYHKAELLRDMGKAQYRTYISVPKVNGSNRWANRGGLYTQQAYTNNHDRVRRAKGKAHLRRRGELLERSFAHVCETGAHRRVRLRGRENVHKRYLIQVAAMNLGIVLRTMLGRGTPKGVAEARKGVLWVLLVLGALVAAVCRLGDQLRASRARAFGAAKGGWWGEPVLVAG